MRRVRSSVNGFTLIELLITTAITGIIALAIFSTFAGGISVYYRCRDCKTAKQDILIALEKMERDLRNTLDYSKIDFVGDKKKISFPALVKTVGPGALGKGDCPAIGRLSYYIDTVNDALVEEKEDYSQATAERSSGYGNKRELTNIVELDFKYFYYDKEAKKHDWRDSWNLDKDKKDGKFPIGVKIELVYKNDGKEGRLVRTVFLPLAQ